jgi:hypothetical protein
MRNIMLGLALVGAVTIGTGAHAAGPLVEQATVQPVYWNGDYCGPRCQEYRWRRHERWEARRRWWHHRRWEERRYGYAYPRY